MIDPEKRQGQLSLLTPPPLKDALELNVIHYNITIY